MSTNQEIALDILHRISRSEATPEECQQLLDIIESDPSPAIIQSITAFYEDRQAVLPALASVDDAYYQSILQKVLSTDKPVDAIIPTVHRVHFLRTAWFRYAAAVILLLGIGGYLLWSDRSEIPTFGGNDKGKVVRMHPPNNKVILTLASGKKIELENTQTPLLVKEGAVFDPSEAGQKPGVAGYNTITTPRGSQYQVVLPDGTKAWLNAASSIRFPTAFTGKERRVETTGEIYFEVAVNKMAPFVVSTKETEIQVLGTNFNVNAYEDESPVKTSLVEGAIKVNNQLLTPGQAYSNGKIITTNLQQDIAWKNGIFDFNNQPLKKVMSEISRWYDVEIVYEDNLPPYDFYGKMGRDLSLDEITAVLSGLGGMKFKVEGKKLIVSK